MLSHIDILKLKIKWGIVDILVPYVYIYTGFEIKHIGTCTDSREREIWNIDCCQVNVVTWKY